MPYAPSRQMIADDLDALYLEGEPHLDPEDRTIVSEDDIALSSEDDRDALLWCLDWETYDR